jgi:hypothetical protein
MQRQSLTTDSLLLHRGVLHRVDARQMPADSGVALGAMCTQSTPQQEPSAYDLKGMDYSDYHGPRPMPGKLSARAIFWRCYLGTLAAGLLALAAWLWA